MKRGAVGTFLATMLLVSVAWADERVAHPVPGIEPRTPEAGWISVAATLGDTHREDFVPLIGRDPRPYRLVAAFPGQVTNYALHGRGRLDAIGPTVGLCRTEDGWTWVDGGSLGNRNRMPGYREDIPGKSIGEFLRGPRHAGELPNNGRWGNWHDARNAMLIEVE